MSDLLRRVQEKEYEAFILVDKLCKENNIKYFMRGGSALGTVKYSGFVPWDDDIDIAIPREDYNRLIEIVPEKLSDEFLFVSYQNTKNSHCYFPRIILSKEYCISNDYPLNNERGLSMIDILPIDGMPDSKIGLMIHIFKAYFYRLLAGLWTLEVKETVSMHDSKKERVLRILYSMKIHRLYTQDAIYRRLDKLYSKYFFMSTSYSGMLASSKLKKEIVPSSWWGEGCLGKFNETEVFLPSEVDLYLKQLFGNNYFETEPEENERIKSHITGIGE